MSSNIFEVNWETREKVLCDRLGSFRNERNLTDVTLLCEGETFYAHRLVLALSSGYFQTSLSTVSNPGLVILMCGIKKSILTTILSFIYDGIATIKKEEIPELLKAGILLEIPGLMDMGSEASNDDEQNSVASHNETQDLSATFHLNEYPDNVSQNFIENDIENVEPLQEVAIEVNDMLEQDARTKLRQRNKKNHMKLRGNNLYCLDCNKKFLSSVKLNDHKRKNIQKTCQNCNCEFSNLCSYSLHSQNCNKDELNNKSEKRYLPQGMTKSKKLCPASTSETSDSNIDRADPQISLKQKINLEASVATLSQKVCSYCNRSFQSIIKYKKHRTTDCDVLQCHFCLKEFEGHPMHVLKDHLMTHEEEERPYSCPQCLFHAEKLCDLENHISAHTGVCRFWCPLCDFQSNHRDQLDLHSNIHPELKVPEVMD